MYLTHIEIKIFVGMLFIAAFLITSGMYKFPGQVTLFVKILNIALILSGSVMVSKQVWFLANSKKAIARVTSISSFEETCRRLIGKGIRRSRPCTRYVANIDFLSPTNALLSGQLPAGDSTGLSSGSEYNNQDLVKIYYHISDPSKHHSRIDFLKYILFSLSLLLMGGIGAYLTFFREPPRNLNEA